MPAKMLADAYGYKIEKGTQGVYRGLVCLLANMKQLRPANNAWSTFPRWTHLSTSLNLAVAAT